MFMDFESLLKLDLCTLSERGSKQRSWEIYLQEQKHLKPHQNQIPPSPHQNQAFEEKKENKG